ncbi:MAG: hypothetical protein AAGN46_00210 [Acidobacteriota bacterium]
MLAFLFRAIFIALFAGLGWFLHQRRMETEHFQSIRGVVREVTTRGHRYVAMVDTDGAHGGSFEFEFVELGDHREGETIDAMWDGRDPSTLRRDLREYFKLGEIACFALAGIQVLLWIVAALAA